MNKTFAFPQMLDFVHQLGLHAGVVGLALLDDGKPPIGRSEFAKIIFDFWLPSASA